MKKILIAVLAILVIAPLAYGSGFHGGSGGGGTASNPGGSPGQVQVNVGNTSFGGVTFNGDGTLNTTTGALTITKYGGVSFGTAASHASTDFVPVTLTINTHALSGNLTLTPTDLGLGNVENAAASGLYVPLTRTVNSHALSSNVTVTASDVGLGSVENAAASTLYLSKTLNNGQIRIGNGSNVATAVTPSGDVTIDNTGVTAIGSSKVVTAMINANAVTMAKLATSLASPASFLLDLSASAPVTGQSYGLLLPAWANYIPSAGHPVTWDDSSKAIKVYSGGWNTIGASGAPVDATYLTLSLNGTLTSERVLTLGNSLSATDGGGNGNYTVDAIQDIRTTATPQFARMGLGVAADGTLLLKVGGASNYMTVSPGGTIAFGGSGGITGYATTASPTFTGTVTLPSAPFTVGATAVTTTGVQFNYLNAATGTTGTTSTNLVFSTSPTLTTPNIGAATGTSLSVTGQLTSTVATGTPPLVVSSTTNVPNLNASSLNGATFAATGPLGGTTPNTAAHTTISASGQITSTVATGSAPFVVASTTPVANLSIGGNAATATTAVNLSGTPALPNGTTATTQSQADNSTKLATTAYVDTGLGTKAPTAGSANVTTLGTITTGVWHGTAIAAGYGGTGVDSSAWTGVPKVTAGVWSNGYTVGVAANNLVQLDSSAKLPALDGSALINLPVAGGAVAANGTVALTANWNAGAYTITALAFNNSKTSGVSGKTLRYSSNSTDVTGVGNKGPSGTLATSWYMRDPLNAPSATSMLTFAAAAADSDGDSSSQASWQTLSTNIQTMLGSANNAAILTNIGAAPSASPTFTGTVTVPTLVIGSTTITSTGTELNYMSGVTSAVQTQLNARATLAANTFIGDQTISAHNIVTDTSTGSKIATATNQKLGFFNATPVAQQTGDVKTALTNLGFVATPTIDADTLGSHAAAYFQVALTNPVTGPASPTAGYLPKWGVSGDALVDGVKLGSTFTDGDWCRFTTAGGFVCDQAAPAGTGDLIHSGTPANHQWAVFTDASHIKGVAVTASGVACIDSNGEPTKCTNLTDAAAAIGGSTGSTDGRLILASGTGGATIKASTGAVDDGSGNLTVASLKTPQQASTNPDYLQLRGYGTNGYGFILDNPNAEGSNSWTLHVWSSEPSANSIPIVSTYSSHAGQLGWQALSANIVSLLGSADYSTARTNLGLAIGTDVQAYNANLTTFAGISPSANIQSLLGSADYSTARINLGLAIGTNVQAYNANLTTYAGIGPSANVQTLLGAADYGAFKSSLSINNVDNTSDSTKWAATADLTNKTYNGVTVTNGTNTYTLTRGTASFSVAAGKTLNISGMLTDGDLCTYTGTGNVFACNTSLAAIGTIGGTTPAPATFTTLTANTALDLANGVAVQTDITTGHTFALAGYNGSSYVNLATVTNAATPTLTLGSGAIIGNGTALETDTTTGHTFTLSAYNGSAYVALLTMTNAATPTINLASGAQLNGTALTSTFAPLAVPLADLNGAGYGTGVTTAMGNAVNGAGGLVVTDGTATFTNKTFDAAGTGNVFKHTNYLVFSHPDRCDGTGATMDTTGTDDTFGHCLFSASAGYTANTAYYEAVVPADLDTTVDLTALWKFSLSGADTNAQCYKIEVSDVADSAARAGSYGTTINLPKAGDASGASGDIETVTATTLTGWRSVLTAGHLMRIRVGRDGGNEGTSCASGAGSTVASYSGPLVISYGSTK
jgi:hypothetical protein